MLKKLLVTIAILLLCFPLAAYGVWKLVEWRTLSSLQAMHIDVQPYIKEIPTSAYDVIVVGGDPEGVAAAVAAAREGASTLLVEQRDGLGGLFTYSMLTFLDYDSDMRKKMANQGIFSEWHKLVGGKVTFDVSVAQNALLKLVQNEPNITLSLNTKLVDAIVDEERAIAAIVVEDENGHHTYTAKQFIDATQDADLAVLAGVPYFTGGEDIGQKERKMAVTLMIHVEGIHWDGIIYTALTRKFGSARFTATAAWGFSELHYTYKPTEPDTRLRGLNIARQSDGSVLINALHLFGVDGLDPTAVQQAIERGKRESDHILNYLKSNFPGFKNARIASYPPELYIRETRHIMAEYQLPITDLWENKDHWDRIGFGAYPVDIQATSIYDYGIVLSDPKQYAIPFRSLVPLEIDNLLVAGKAAGYSSLAAGSARIVPTGMTAGQAAGVAAAIATREQVTPRQLSANENLILQLQNRLLAQGANLYPFELPFAYEGEWFYPAIRTLLSYGLVSGGYRNDMEVNVPIGQLEFAYLLFGCVERAVPEAYSAYKQRLDQIYQMAQKETTPLTREQAARFLLTLYGQSEEGDAWAKAQSVPELQQVLDEQITGLLNRERELSRSEGYYLAAKWIDTLKQQFH